MQEQLIRERIESILPDAEVELTSPDGVHYSATVRSSGFYGMKRLEQHRMVMNALKDVISSNEVHALALKTEIK